MATIKSAVVERSELAPNGVFVIRPTISGEEWTVHNIYVPFGNKTELYRCNDPTGADLGILMYPVSVTLSGQYGWHCTTDEFLAIKNIDTSIFYVGYDGVVTNTS